MCDSNSDQKLTRAEQARLNGAQSRGPITPEGKFRSSLNALKHGAYASHAVLLANEDPVAYQLSLEAYVRRFKPADPFEHNVVCELCNTDWILRRSHAIQTSLINQELTAQQIPAELEDSPCPEPELTATAVLTLGDRSRTFAQVQRQIHLLNVARDRLLETLAHSRQKFPITERTQDLDLPAAPEEGQ